MSARNGDPRSTFLESKLCLTLVNDPNGVGGVEGVSVHRNDMWEASS